MLRHRLLLYFSAVAAMTIAATIVGEIFLVERVVKHARRSDLRLANGVAHHVEATLDEAHRHLVALLERLPLEPGAATLREPLSADPGSLFEEGGVSVFTQELWEANQTGGAATPDDPPRQTLLTALRAARDTGTLGLTPLWRGKDGKPRVSLVSVENADPGRPGWRAAVGNVRLDERAFLSRFGFFLSDPDVRLQILDGRGHALFSTVADERYRSVVHRSYLLDRVRQGQSMQLKCHSCHEGPRGERMREEEIATLAPVKETHWSVLVREDPVKVQQMLKEVVATVVALVCLILGAFSGFYWLLTRRVLQPLRQLASAAAAVSAARPATHPQAIPRDELQILAHSFERMRGEFQAAAVRPAQAPPPSKGSPFFQLEPASAASGELREALQRTLTSAVEGFRTMATVSAILVVVRGEALGEPPLVVGTLDPNTVAIEAQLRAVQRGRELVTREELAASGLDTALCNDTDTFYRRELRGSEALRGEVWVGTCDHLASSHLKPIAVLIALHVQGIVELSLLTDNLRHEHRQKSRMLGHLFEAEAEERKRIAREIHDDTAQGLAALLLLLETFPVGGTAQAQAAAVATVKERVGGIIDSTDRIMKRLRPALLDDLGLIDAVRSLGEDVLVSQGVDFDLDAPKEDIRAAPEIEDAIFRVFQEAASNVVRHAQATHVSASLEVADGQVVGSFEDDGRGMQAVSAAEKVGERPRFGLLGMRERIEQLGGSLHLSACEGGGLRIDLAVPYRSGDRGGDMSRDLRS